jgi:hypothetical protein
MHQTARWLAFIPGQYFMQYQKTWHLVSADTVTAKRTVGNASPLMPNLNHDWALSFKSLMQSQKEVWLPRSVVDQSLTTEFSDGLGGRHVRVVKCLTYL